MRSSHTLTGVSDRVIAYALRSLSDAGKDLALITGDQLMTAMRAVNFTVPSSASSRFFCPAAESGLAFCCIFRRYLPRRRGSCLSFYLVALLQGVSGSIAFGILNSNQPLNVTVPGFTQTIFTPAFRGRYVRPQHSRHCSRSVWSATARPVAQPTSTIACRVRIKSLSSTLI